MTDAIYAPHGGLLSMKHGFRGSTCNPQYAGTTVTNSYNKRLQPITLSAAAPSATLISFTYDFDLNVANNGSVKQIINNLDGNRTQNFAYDDLNRIRTAQSAGNLWGSDYTIDPWGNMMVQPLAGKPTGENFQISSSNLNRVNTFCYDSAGNLLGESNCSAYTYDAENRLKTAGGVTYTYDADGRRVKKSNGKLYWHNLGGNEILETDLAGATLNKFIYFNGQRVARWDAGGNMYYYFADHLGTSRVMSTSLGGKCYDADYYPYGGEQAVYLNTCPQNYKFTGKERDGESGLDYFIARSYASTFGRFLQADEFSGGPVDVFSSNDPLPPGPLPYADITNPQALNKYPYALNDPLRYIDPDGHDFLDKVSGAANAWVSDNLGGFGRAEPYNSDFAEGQAYGDAAAVVTGAIEAKLGDGLMIGGAGACSTGGGCAAGAPAAAVGAVAELHGAATAATALVHLAKSASDVKAKPPGENQAAAAGRAAHADFAAKVKGKPGWQSQPSLTDPKSGKALRPDATTPRGKPVELKPRTATGVARGRTQLRAQERATGKKGRVVYYRPKKKAE